jgi:hypothetical protein
MLRRCGVATCIAGLVQAAVLLLHRTGVRDSESVSPAPSVSPLPFATFFSSASLAQRDERRRQLVAPLHVRQQVGAAAIGCAFGPSAARNLRRLAHRLRRAVLEPRQAHHDRRLRERLLLRRFLDRVAVAALPRRRHDHRLGIRNLREFRRPDARFFPCALSAERRKTLSGVIGISSIRTPTAS